MMGDVDGFVERKREPRWFRGSGYSGRSHNTLDRGLLASMMERRNDDDDDAAVVMNRDAVRVTRMRMMRDKQKRVIQVESTESEWYANGEASVVK